LKTLTKLILFSIGGLLAGLASLIGLITFIPLSDSPSIFVLSAGAFLEEMVKLLFLIFLLNSLSLYKSFKLSIVFVIVFGVSFSIFELILLLIDKNIVNYTFLYSTVIHIITSLIILASIAIYKKKHKLSTLSFAFFTLALFIHLCYNLIVLKFV